MTKSRVLKINEDNDFDGHTEVEFMSGRNNVIGAEPGRKFSFTPKTEFSAVAIGYRIQSHDQNCNSSSAAGTTGSIQSTGCATTRLEHY